MIELSPECEAIVLRAARETPDCERDAFFRHAADIVRPWLNVSEADAERAVALAKSMLSRRAA